MLLAVGAVLGALVGALVEGVWLTAACLVIAAFAAIVRRPSIVRAARVADRQLQTSSRLATAAEVLEGRLGGALAADQLDDAWRTASTITAWRAFPRSWRQVELALATVLVSVVVVALSVTGVVTPIDVVDLVGGPATPDQSDTAAMTQADSTDQALADTSLPTANSMDELQSQAAQSQAAQAALQKLGDSLRQTSAARDVGDALRSGNYDQAITRLDTLATQSDQLSRVSKRELGAAMERAAVDSAQIDPPLAVAEDRVARALTRNVYSDTRSAMQDLAKAVGDAKNGVISQEALARELEQLRQQQQQPATPGGGGGDIGESGQGYIPDIPGEAPNQVGLVQGVSSTISAPGPEGDPNKSARSSVGTETGGDPFGDLTSRLDVPANDLSVDAQVSADQSRSAIKANPAAPVVKISDATQNSVTPSDVAQPTDPVQAVGEHGVESNDQRSAVRTFFKPPTDNGANP